MLGDFDLQAISNTRKYRSASMMVYGDLGGPSPGLETTQS